MPRMTPTPLSSSTSLNTISVPLRAPIKIFAMRMRTGDVPSTKRSHPCAVRDAIKSGAGSRDAQMVKHWAGIARVDRAMYCKVRTSAVTAAATTRCSRLEYHMVVRLGKIAERSQRPNAPRGSSVRASCSCVNFKSQDKFCVK
jgi:hypothetical protein